MKSDSSLNPFWQIAWLLEEFAQEFERQGCEMRFTRDCQIAIGGIALFCDFAEAPC